MTHPTRPPRASWLSIPMTIVVLTATMLIPAASAIAVEPTDTVLEWNTNAINAIQNANGATPPGLAQVPPLAPVNLAIVHAAIYDAVNAIDGTHQPYLLNIHAPPERLAGRSRRDGRASRARRARPGDPAPGDRQPRRRSTRRLWARSPMARPSPTKSASVNAAAAVLLADRLDDGRNGTPDVRRRHRPGRVAARAAAQQQCLLVGRRDPPVQPEARGPDPDPRAAAAQEQAAIPRSSTRSRRWAPRPARLAVPSSRPWRTGSSSIRSAR